MLLLLYLPIFMRNNSSNIVRNFRPYQINQIIFSPYTNKVNQHLTIDICVCAKANYTHIFIFDLN